LGAELRSPLDSIIDSNPTPRTNLFFGATVGVSSSDMLGCSARLARLRDEFRNCLPQGFEPGSLLREVVGSNLRLWDVDDRYPGNGYSINFE
jgi:hypothetical protein